MLRARTGFLFTQDPGICNARAGQEEGQQFPDARVTSFANRSSDASSLGCCGLFWISSERGLPRTASFLTSPSAASRRCPFGRRAGPRTLCVRPSSFPLLRRAVCAEPWRCLHKPVEHAVLPQAHSSDRFCCHGGLNQPETAWSEFFLPGH